MNNNTEKAISLFKYIKELYTLKTQVVADVRDQQWCKFTHEIPDDEENITFNYFDRTDDENNEEAEPVTILRIKKPDFEQCPSIPPLLIDWIESDWKNYIEAVIPMEKHVEYNNDKEIAVFFADDKDRVKAFREWSKKRDFWVNRQVKIEKTRDFFNDLYYRYIDLERDSETIELMVGQGVLDCQVRTSMRAFHPLLLKRVSMNFDSRNNIITISDADTNTEIYTMLLQGIDCLIHSSIKSLKDELLENFYHPLDRIVTPDYLKTFAHKLHHNGKYEDNYEAPVNMSDKVIIYNNPVLFIRKRTGGVLKMIEEIIEHISTTDELPGPLLNLIGENVSQTEESKEELDLSQSLAAISGEDKDILLSKEANKEQLKIAKRILNYNAVLVQGPPGTGKTHTIANLMGHFLAQGKNILVTSHTKKALAVVKEKVVPELQNLCVAVLDDNNRDMERSVDGITDYISSHSLLQLEDDSSKLKEKRDSILEKLADIRNKLHAIKSKEYETIFFGGNGYTVAEAASFVLDNQDILSYLPGKVTLNKTLPVSISDLELLYHTNSEISIEDEIELNYKLPDPKELLSPTQFSDLLEEKRHNKNLLQDIKQKLDGYVQVFLNRPTATIDGQPICENFDIVKADELDRVLKKEDKRQFAKWELNAIIAGKNGSGFKDIWENLIDLIQDAFQFAGETEPLIFGKKIDIPEEYTSEKSIEILKEIKAHFDAGKRICFIKLLVQKQWKSLINDIKINNQKISSPEHCNILISMITLRLKRNEIKELWTNLIENHDGVAFSEFGDKPELSCISFKEQIEKCLNWYNEAYKELKTKIVDCGFREECINVSKHYTNPTQEVENLLHLMYKIVPQYIKLAEILYVKTPGFEAIIKENREKLEVCGFQSAICANILCAIKNENVEAYKKHYEALDSLFSKYTNQSERKRILKSIGEYAPDWAKLIENRKGIHGESKVPDNIEDAWKWKQFSGIIDQITEQPFEELQRRAVSLSSELKTTTIALAENFAWYHLLFRIDGDISQKQALQGWKLTTKKIGKGTGKTAPKLKKEAQKLMAKCQSAVPAWIMPINKALESLDPAKNKFDIVIIDEASQSDISALAIIYLAKKIIIVGDDEQVSPSAVGVDVDKMSNLSDMHIKDIIPNAHLYDMKSSLYDIAKTTFPIIVLKEHFRCVPSIIGYSNRLAYDYKIKPLRDDSNVPIKPATISYRVDGQRNSKKRNDIEAENIVALMLACIEQPEYDGMTFGAISLLGDEQAKAINDLAIKNISPQDYEKRRILCGNASHFQGDERDVIFISLVDSNEGDGPLRMTGEGVGKSTKQRYNVAVSRAKNQLWVVHSLDVNNDLKSGDMRKDLIEYVSNPLDFEQQESKIRAKADSPFEISVANYLVKNGYSIVQQWAVGSYRIDMVALCGNKKVAIECDGELYHSGDDKVRADMERQAILERLGWRFIRIRGSEYYRNPKNTMNRVISELNILEIEPEQNIQINSVQDTELQARVVSTAEHIMDKWKHSDILPNDLIKDSATDEEKLNDAVKDASKNYGNSNEEFSKIDTPTAGNYVSKEQKADSQDLHISNVFKEKKKSLLIEPLSVKTISSQLKTVLSKL